MNRDVVIVLGKTGFGKSLWAKMFVEKYQRKFIYDPSLSFKCEFMPGEELYQRATEIKPADTFSLGLWDRDEVPIIGNVSFAIGDNLLVLEEVSNVFPKGIIRLPDWAKNTIFYGRHARQSLLFIAQRATSVPIDFRSQPDRVVTFQQHEGNDLDALVPFYGKERVNRIPTLPKLTCFDYCQGQVEEYNIQYAAEKYLGRKIDLGQNQSIMTDVN